MKEILKTIFKVIIGIPIILLCIIIEPVVGEEVPEKMRKFIGLDW